MDATRIRACNAPCGKADSLRFPPARAIGGPAGLRGTCSAEAIVHHPCGHLSPRAGVTRHLSESSRDTVATDAAVTTATATAIHDSWATTSATKNRAQPSLSTKPDSLRSIRVGPIPKFPARGSRRADDGSGARAEVTLLGPRVRSRPTSCPLRLPRHKPRPGRDHVATTEATGFGPLGVHGGSKPGTSLRSIAARLRFINARCSVPSGAV